MQYPMSISCETMKAKHLSENFREFTFGVHLLISRLHFASLFTVIQ